MDREYINYAAATEKARNVLDLADKMTEDFNRLTADIEGKIGTSGEWTGAAAEGFIRAWYNFTDSFRSQLGHVLTVQDQIEYANNEFKKAQQEMANATPTNP